MVPNRFGTVNRLGGGGNPRTHGWVWHIRRWAWLTHRWVWCTCEHARISVVHLWVSGACTHRSVTCPHASTPRPLANTPTHPHVRESTSRPPCMHAGGSGRSVSVAQSCEAHGPALGHSPGLGTPVVKDNTKCWFIYMSLYLYISMFRQGIQGLVGTPPPITWIRCKHPLALRDYGNMLWIDVLKQRLVLLRRPIRERQSLPHWR